MSSYYSQKELMELGLKSVGNRVLISRKASIYFPENLSIGDNVRIDDFAILSAKNYIELHDHIHIGAHSLILGGGGIIIESFSGISPYSCLLSESDDFSGKSLMGPMIDPEYRSETIKGAIVLKKHSVVGLRSTIMPGITIKEGSIIGPHSVLTKNTIPWYVYIGVPARRLKPRVRDIEAAEGPFLESFNASLSKSAH